MRNKHMTDPTNPKTLFVIMRTYSCFDENHVEPLLIFSTLVFAQDYISSLNIQLSKTKKLGLETPCGEPYWVSDMLKEAITWGKESVLPTLELETEFYIHETKMFL